MELDANSSPLFITTITTDMVMDMVMVTVMVTMDMVTIVTWTWRVSVATSVTDLAVRGKIMLLFYCPPSARKCMLVAYAAISTNGQSDLSKGTILYLPYWQYNDISCRTLANLAW